MHVEFEADTLTMKMELLQRVLSRGGEAIGEDLLTWKHSYYTI